MVNSADQVQILFEAVACRRLDDHSGTIPLPGPTDMGGGAGRGAHIVQAVEEGHEVEPGFPKILCRAHLETRVPLDPCKRACARAASSLSNKQIAAADGLAPSSAHERLKRLREDVVLHGSHAEVSGSRRCS